MKGKYVSSKEYLFERDKLTQEIQKYGETESDKEKLSFLCDMLFQFAKKQGKLYAYSDWLIDKERFEICEELETELKEIKSLVEGL